MKIFKIVTAIALIINILGGLYFCFYAFTLWGTSDYIVPMLILVFNVINQILALIFVLTYKPKE